MSSKRTTALLLVALVLLATAPAAAGHEGAHAAPAQHAHQPKPKAGRRAGQQARQGKDATNRYACPMHPDVTSASPGRCHECGMALKAEPKTEAGTETKTEAQSQPAATGAGPKSGEAPRIADVPVLDQDGRRLNFYTDLVKGRTVVINFVFTTCTTVCPPLSATFRKVQQELGARAGREVALISVSVDPVTDTPERLKGFAAKFKAGPGWTFVTGGKPEIGALLKSLGAATPDKNDHTPMILVGNDAAGHWTRTYGIAPASTLVKVIDEVAAVGSRAAETRPAGGEKTLAEASANYFPNHVLITQDNKPVRFYDDLLKGKVVLINFMFTTCTGVCPPMTGNMAKVRNYLGDRVGRDVVMISISVDPAVDTPEGRVAKTARGRGGRGSLIRYAATPKRLSTNLACPAVSLPSNLFT